MQYTLIEEPTNYEIYKETNDYIEYTGTKTFNFDIHQTFFAILSETGQKFYS